MKTKRFKCRHCKKIHSARVEDQKYCGEVQCQRARRNAWYREKCAGDADYRANQRASNQAWLKSKGGAAVYYREYRRRRKREEEGAAELVGSTPERETFNEGLGVGFGSEIKGPCKSANIDATSDKNFLKSGRYKICPADANIDAILVEISTISSV